MLLYKAIVMLIMCWLIKCDLLDLYVQHMDETMRTRSYRHNRHPVDSVPRRIKRGLGFRFRPFELNFDVPKIDLPEIELPPNELPKYELPRPELPPDDFVKEEQSHLDEMLREENMRYLQAYKDVLRSMNKRKENPNLEEERERIFTEGTAKSASINTDDEAEPKISQNPMTEEHEEKKHEMHLPHLGDHHEENRTDTVYPLETERWKQVIEDLEEPQKTEDDTNPLVEIIRESERDFSHDDPSLKKTPKSSGRQAPKKYSPIWDKLVKSAEKTKASLAETASDRRKRSVESVNFIRHEELDENGDVVLEWDPSDEDEVVFRVTGKTTGYVGIGFNEKTSMRGADLLLAWVNDHTGVAYVLDAHGSSEMSENYPIMDSSQDVRVINGSQNGTHTTVTFARNWRTCDPQDYTLTGDSVRVLWALHENDPELNTGTYHKSKRGGRALRLKTAVTHSPSTKDLMSWDIKLSLFEVSDMSHTIYWCKIFRVPVGIWTRQHHMIGYEPLVEKANENLVHHMILYECTSMSPLLAKQVKLVGSNCYSTTMPHDWQSCLQPIVTWARGSKGEWLPEHVGIPIAERGEHSYYMLEVHYNNPHKKKVLDSSGLRLYMTPMLRREEAGILVTGVAVSPLHLVPPKQKEYATAGYCTPHCTTEMFPNRGINVVSVVLHSHLAGRRLSLKHIRQGVELPRIVQDNRFDFDYQQSYILEKEVNVLPGDELVAECVYGTLDRTKPTIGGYAVFQEMCLAFVLHYPRTQLAACYSMTPVEELFKTLGVISFKGIMMESVVRIFMGNDFIPSSTERSVQLLPFFLEDYNLVKEINSSMRAMTDYTKNDSDNIFTKLVIQQPNEFLGRTMAEHMSALPWTEELLTRSIERNLYHGKHMTFCRKRDDNLVMPPEIQLFPNYTALNSQPNDTVCKLKTGSSGAAHTLVINLVIISAVLILQIQAGL